MNGHSYLSLPHGEHKKETPTVYLAQILKSIEKDNPREHSPEFRVVREAKGWRMCDGDTDIGFCYPTFFDIWSFSPFEPPEIANPEPVGKVVDLHTLHNTTINLAPHGWPAHWILVRRLSEGGGEVIWDESNRPRACPGIAYDRSGAVCLQQTLRVEPGTVYHLAGRIRTQALDGLACFQMAFLDALGAAIEDGPDIARGMALRGTTDWTPDAFDVVAPPRAAVMEVRVFLTGKGRAWMKDLIVTA